MVLIVDMLVTPLNHLDGKKPYRTWDKSWVVYDYAAPFVEFAMGTFATVGACVVAGIFLVGGQILSSSESTMATGRPCVGQA